MIKLPDKAAASKTCWNVLHADLSLATHGSPTALNLSLMMEGYWVTTFSRSPQIHYPSLSTYTPLAWSDVLNLLWLLCFNLFLSLFLSHSLTFAKTTTNNIIYTIFISYYFINYYYYLYSLNYIIILYLFFYFVYIIKWRLYLLLFSLSFIFTLFSISISNKINWFL